MRKSCHQQNASMLEAYQAFHNGQHQQAIQIYETLLKKTPDVPSNITLRTNIITTVAVLSMSLGNYNYSMQLLQDFVSVHKPEQFLKNNHNKDFSIQTQIRIHSNLILLKLLNGSYEESLKLTEKLCDFVRLVLESDGNVDKDELVKLVMMLFYRVESLEQLREYKFQDGLDDKSLSQCFYGLNVAFCQSLLKVGHPKNILIKLYPIFLKYNHTKLSLVCLRQLFNLKLTQEEEKYYESQIKQILQSGALHSYQFDNTQAIKYCQAISQKILDIFNLHKPSQSLPSNISEQQEWKMVIRYEHIKLLKNTEINEQQRGVVEKNIMLLMQEKNLSVIRQLKKLDFYKNALMEIQNFVKSRLIGLMRKKVDEQLRLTFDVLKQTKMMNKVEENSKIVHKKIFLNNITNSNTQSAHNTSITHSRTISASKISKITDNLSLLPSYKNHTPQKQKSNRSVSHHGRSSKENTPNSKIFKNYRPTNSKLTAKMLRYCECGSFLSKRNYNSNGGEYRFVRLSAAVIRWAKNPESIENNSQVYPLKDIRSIHYGKCTPTLLKPSNNFLQNQFCFSLHLQKRTLDFHCKDSEQARNWVCGLSQKMKTINPKFKGYTHGKFLWMKMFMKLRQNFTVKLRPHEKNYYYETAQAIVLFGKNNYQIPKAN